jgi:hypothetical protein
MKPVRRRRKTRISSHWGPLRNLRLELVESRLLLTAVGLDADDAALERLSQSTDESSHDAFVRDPQAQIRMEVTDFAGNALSAARLNDDFLLSVFVRDLRDRPMGVFAAYLDLHFDPQHVSRSGDLTFGNVYRNGVEEGGNRPGLLDDVGGFSTSLSPIGGGEYLLFRAPLRAVSEGEVSFVAQPANRGVQSLVLLYGYDHPPSMDTIQFGSTSLMVVADRPIIHPASLEDRELGFLSVHSVSGQTSDLLSPDLLRTVSREHGSHLRGDSELPTPNRFGQRNSAETIRSDDDLVDRHLFRLESALLVSPTVSRKHSVDAVELAPQPKAVWLEANGDRARWTDADTSVLDITEDRKWVLELSISNDTTDSRKADVRLYDRHWRRAGLVRVRWVGDLMDPELSIQSSAGELLPIEDALIDLTDLAAAWQDLVDIDDDEETKHLESVETLREEDYLFALDTLFALGISLESHRGLARAMEVASVRTPTVPTEDIEARRFASEPKSEVPANVSEVVPGEERKVDLSLESVRSQAQVPAAE